MAMFYVAVFLVTWTVVSGSTTCGIIDIDDSSRICCNGKSHPKNVNSREQACCTPDFGDGVLYDTTKSHCCSGTIRETNIHMEIDEPFCCGNALISNQRVEICCNGKIYQRKDYYCDTKARIALLLSEIACYKKDSPEDYTVYRLKNVRCCGKGKLNVNNQTHKCEDEEVVPIRGPKECGKEEYFLDEAVCCKSGEGKPDYVKPIPKDIKFHGVDPLVQCINGEIIDEYKEEVLERNGRTIIIPKGKLHCGNTYFDKDSMDPMVHCCDGVLNYNRPGSNVQCCGDVTIDPTKVTCCNNTIYPLKKLCCGDSVYDREQNDVTCCEQKLVNTSSHICCTDLYQEMSKTKTDALDDRCCGMTPYNTGKKACCGEIVDKWNTTTHECKNDEVQEKPENLTVIIKEKIKNITLIKNPTQREVVNNCVCPTYLTPGMDCTKRNEYRFFVLKKHQNKQLMEVVLLTPKSLEGIGLTLRSKDMCRCIEELSSYSMFTNRDYRQKILDQAFSLVFSRRDIISKLSMVGSRMRPAVQCKLYRFHKEPRS